MQEAGEAAQALQSEAIVKVPEVGEVYDGEVVGIKDFGAFVQASRPARTACFTSPAWLTAAWARLRTCLPMGDIVKVEVIEVSDNGKISLDRVDKPDVVSAERPSRHHEDGERRGKREDCGNGGRKPRRRHNGERNEH